MADQNGSAPDGPDLQNEGIVESDLAVGDMLLGNVGDEGVLLVRTEDTVYAIGATCSHYGGPLADGLFDGSSVRCPWHHACFDAATGRAVRAPARDAIATYDVESRDGRLFVTHEADHRFVPTPPEHAPSSVVIVGGGAAGEACAETLRDEGYEGPIVILSADSDPPVDRPNLSKDFLAGAAEPDWLPLRDPEWYREHHIELRLETEVTHIDASARRVELADGESIEYGRLLLAPGSEPIVLDLPGDDASRLRTLRSWADSRGLASAAENASRAVVIGASFIGTEAAASLAQRGLEVHVVAPEALPLTNVLGPEFGAMVRALHEKHGVTFHLGTTVERLDGDTVVLEDGTRIEADLVLAGVGVRPRLDLARDAGLEVDDGVLVDERLRASAEDIWAAGDVASWPDPLTGRRIRVEHWVVAQRQGATAARNMLGHDEAFDLVPFFWTQQYDITINYVGHATDWNEAHVMGDIAAHDGMVAFSEARGTMAVASVFRDRASLEAEVALEHRDQREVAEWLERQS
ncbi:MAG: FAD-dependent oxidoreductase [Dehalococcoidia bacterium]